TKKIFLFSWMREPYRGFNLYKKEMPRGEPVCDRQGENKERFLKMKKLFSPDPGACRRGASSEK
ncbi:MAG TPA: hypothetical protein PKC14_04670, partial [Candidatus Absconditabacterales bacterium]|nr:hypothetical protein [Candidatus Absconditabacterales bacterium]